MLGTLGASASSLLGSRLGEPRAAGFLGSVSDASALQGCRKQSGQRSSPQDNNGLSQSCQSSAAGRPFRAPPDHGPRSGLLSPASTSPWVSVAWRRHSWARPLSSVWKADAGDGSSGRCSAAKLPAAERQGFRPRGSWVSRPPQYPLYFFCIFFRGNYSC